MEKLILTLLLLLSFSSANSQKSEPDQSKIQEDLNKIITDLAENYVYLQEKNVDLDCIRETYEKQIPNIKTEEETVLFFEYLLDEFYDSHLILNTNRSSSFRLFAPIYATIETGTPIISNVWQTQIDHLTKNLVGAELLKINGIEPDKAIEQFPTHCNDKNAPQVREWTLNKIVAGRYNEPRILTLRLANKEVVEFDLDKIRLKREQDLLTVKKINDIGIIRLNNSLGRDEVVNEFDKALDALFDTKGLIIDLRNTVDGGDSYEARGIMGRFITAAKPYQKHHFVERSYNDPDANPKIERSWIEYVSPRGQQYKKPVIILVGRWTGSMGEGLAIGFEGMGRAEIVGSEMERLAGEMSGFSFRHQNFGYRLSTTKLFHLNGVAREKYVPTHYVKQTTTERDETLEKGIELINEMAE